MLKYSDEEIGELLTLSHFNKPILNPSVSVTARNPGCGDLINSDLFIMDGIIKGIFIDAKGCVLSRASAELWGRAIIGKTVAEVVALPQDSLLSELGEISPMRVTCALIFYSAVKERLLSWS